VHAVGGESLKRNSRACECNKAIKRDVGELFLTRVKAITAIRVNDHREFCGKRDTFEEGYFWGLKEKNKKP
jgi:hypothetical protein